MKKLQEIASKHEGMFWDTRVDGLSDSAILERIISYGSWEDYKEVECIIGKERAKEIFIERAYIPRTNIREITINLFTHYFHVTPPPDRTPSRAI